MKSPGVVLGIVGVHYCPSGEISTGCTRTWHVTRKGLKSKCNSIHHSLMFLCPLASQFNVAISSESIYFRQFTSCSCHLYAEFSSVSELYDSWNIVHLCNLTIHTCTFLILISEKFSPAVEGQTPQYSYLPKLEFWRENSFVSVFTAISVPAQGTNCPPVYGERKAFSMRSLDVVKLVSVSYWSADLPCGLTPASN